jgi:uncharacterized protein
MINVIFKKSQDIFLSFYVKGHADFADYGKDIVCSSVSTVAQYTIIGVTDTLNIKAKYAALEGDISLDLSNLSPKEIDKSQNFMKTMFKFCIGLTDAYGKYVKVNIEEV